MPIIETHPDMLSPKSNITLWRYMDIPSFLSIITEEVLTFVRADLFEDRYEGVSTILTSKMINDLIREEINRGNIGSSLWNYTEFIEKNSLNPYLSCWCKEDHEMVHMWKVYSKESGIAIETNYENLKHAINAEDPIFATEIRYVDYHNDVIDWSPSRLLAFATKRKEYKSENEFRLILPFPKKLIQNTNLDNKERMNVRPEVYLNTHVLKLKINISVLISRIHISPYAPKWYLNLIKDILAKFNLGDKEVLQSDL